MGAQIDCAGRPSSPAAASDFDRAGQVIQNHAVLNYCPLVFMEESGRNRTPDKLPAAEQAPLLEICDRALRQSVEEIGARRLVGIGLFAEKRLVRGFGGDERFSIHRILHPSPASPAANSDWKGKATAQLVEAGIWD